MYEQKQDMISNLVRQLRAKGIVWPTVSEVLHDQAPELPPKWRWRTRAGVPYAYCHYEQSDIIVVPSRYESSHV